MIILTLPTVFVAIGTSATTAITANTLIAADIPGACGLGVSQLIKYAEGVALQNTFRIGPSSNKNRPAGIPSLWRPPVVVSDGASSLAWGERVSSAPTVTSPIGEIKLAGGLTKGVKQGEEDMSPRTQGEAVESIVELIRARLEENRDEDHAEGAKKYFGKDFKCYGVPAAKPKIRRFITEALRQAHLSGTKVDFALRMQLAEDLLKSEMYEEGQAAIILIQDQGRYFTTETLSIFRMWLDRYINNWGICDSFCIGVVDQVIKKYPKKVNTLLNDWAQSKNPWVRRAACATLSKLARDGSFAIEVTALVDILLENNEGEDIVHKAMGWVLKELSRTKPQFVVDYLNSRPGQIPTVTLHHSLERISKNQGLYRQVDRGRIRKK